MRAASSSNGKPLIALIGILAGWVVIRLVLVQFDGVLAFPSSAIPFAEATPPALIEMGSEQNRTASVPSESVLPPRPAMGQSPQSGALPLSGSHNAAQASSDGQRVSTAAGHQMLWMAALSKLPLPRELASLRTARQSTAPFYPAGRESSDGKRWSADSWLVLRRSGTDPHSTRYTLATYGASQMGGVLRAID